ncbi:multiple inositol polyphosphate phosphatase 1-like [Ylistrum balloti]|uniref:multiple inositol polyphosphate phosphatase 1-like n=1 Tax=Ylistrum balloti TaxID=509963 RepID=UPI002905A9D1|nr:multiple inositol polyphosphate phosphatase 1-like [Ylistrum balloti]
MVWSFSNMLLLVICVSFAASIQGSSSFYGKLIFGSKTPYFWERDANQTIGVDSGMTITHNGKTCTAFYVDALLRHGARYPTSKYIANMNSLVPKLRNLPRAAQHPFLNTWVNRFPLDLNGQLSFLGRQEQYSLGKRFLSRFHSLLHPASDRFKYYASYKKRTQDSSNYFQQGVTGRQMTDDFSNDTQPTINNIMLRFYSNCHEYSISVLNNHSAIAEYFKFQRGPEFTAMMKAVSDRVTAGHFNLTFSELMTVHQYCTVELGMFKSSDWCSFFTEEDIEVIDYEHDLYNYWLKSYGHAINSEITCPMFVDVFGNIDKAIQADREGQSYTVGTFRFGHAETLLPIYSALSLFHDSTPLLASNYNAHRNRTYRTSKIAPFSGNIYPVLYKCGDELGDIYLKMFVNEVETPLPACGLKLCPYYLLKSEYSDAINNCRFDVLCHNIHSTMPSAVVG